MLLWHQLIWKVHFTLYQWLHIKSKNFCKWISYVHMHAKSIWSCHENLYKDHKSTIFSTQDAGSYLSCICRRFLLARRHLWKLFAECKWYNNYVAIIRFYHSSWKFIIHSSFILLKPAQNLIYSGFIKTLKIWLWNWQERKNKTFMTFVPNFLKNQSWQYDL